MAVSTDNFNFEFIPPAEGKQQALTLLVHGRGGRLPLMLWLAKRFSIPGMAYLSIEAPFPEDVPEMKQPGFSWYVGPEFEGLDESRSRLESLLEELSEQNCPSEKIFWIGFSQGGVMGLDLALRSSSLLGGVFNISGLCIQLDSYPEAFGRMAKKQRIVCTHGRRDSIIEFERAESDYTKLKSLGISLEFREYSKPHSFELKNEIPEIESTLRSWMES